MPSFNRRLRGESYSDMRHRDDDAWANYMDKFTAWRKMNCNSSPAEETPAARASSATTLGKQALAAKPTKLLQYKPITSLTVTGLKAMKGKAQTPTAEPVKTPKRKAISSVTVAPLTNMKGMASPVGDVRIASALYSSPNGKAPNTPGRAKKSKRG